MDYLWHPAVDLCWDISRGLPFASGTLQGIFSEHCLEHFSISVTIGILRECRRVLRADGTLRIVVPDAELYMSVYCRQIGGDTGARFPFPLDPGPEGLVSPILNVNRVFYQDRDSPQGHRAMYDFHLLAQILRSAGFRSVERRAYRDGKDATLLIDSESRACESLYVEAVP